MAKKHSKQTKSTQVAENKVSLQESAEIKKKVLQNLGIASYTGINPYLPGVLIFIIMTVIASFTYKDYGVSWDEPELRAMGLYSFNYMFHGDQTLFAAVSDHHGAGFQLFLIIIEKLLRLTDARDIYLMRHMVTHLVFLLSGFCLYILILNLYKNKFLACLGNIIFILSPRLYAHSFFNGGDIPFLSVFLASLTVSYFAFLKNKSWLFLILGILCGFATSIRIMGILLSVFVLFFLLIDLITALKNKEKIRKILVNSFLFIVGFCLTLYLSWPYLWKSPIAYFIESFSAFSHFPWNGYILINGKHMTGENISWTYFPIWFLVTVPEVWIVAGFTGVLLIIINFSKKPLSYLKNNQERNFLLYLLCFFVPVMSVIFLHSVIYNDWRHLYFVYPPFLLLALYCVNKVLRTKYKLIAQGICILQIVLVGFFMVQNHPFQQIYFNNLVSHANEYLHDNYELEYWGVSFKQAIDHLLESDNSKVIKINCFYKTELENNILLLSPEDRNRIQFAEIENADYYITNFWAVFYIYPFYKIDYSINVLNSPIMCTYKVEKDAASQKQYRDCKLASLKKEIADNPKNYDACSKIGKVYFVNAQYDSAEVYAKQALFLNSDDIDLINNLAAVYGTEGKYLPAIELYKHAIKIYPEKVLPFTNTGLSYIYLGKYDSAIYYLKKAISINPSYNPSFENLASAYNAAGTLDSAKKYEAIARKNNSAFKL